jgi:hypothetical protein
MSITGEVSKMQVKIKQIRDKVDTFIFNVELFLNAIETEGKVRGYVV